MMDGLTFQDKDGQSRPIITAQEKEELISVIKKLENYSKSYGKARNSVNMLEMILSVFKDQCRQSGLTETIVAEMRTYINTLQNQEPVQPQSSGKFDPNTLIRERKRKQMPLKYQSDNNLETAV